MQHCTKTSCVHIVRMLNIILRQLSVCFLLSLCGSLFPTDIQQKCEDKGFCKINFNVKQLTPKVIALKQFSITFNYGQKCREFQTNNLHNNDRPIFNNNIMGVLEKDIGNKLLRYPMYVRVYLTVLF